MSLNRDNPQVSNLCHQPKSRILERSYLNVYSHLDPRERRQLAFTRKYKKLHPKWDSTLVLLCREFERSLDSFAANSGRWDRVLDFGCGNGNYVIDEFRSRIDWACGVDISPTETTNNVCLDEILCLRGGVVPYPDNYFSTVLALWVFEHIQYPALIFKELHRVLKPGGSLIFSTPNRSCLLLRVKSLINGRFSAFFNTGIYGRTKESIYPTFYRANDLATLRKLLDEAGFKYLDLRLNYEPGFTSFNDLTFILSDLVQGAVGRIIPEIFSQRIVGIAHKPRQ